MRTWQHAAGILSEVRQRKPEPPVLRYIASTSARDQSGHWQQASGHLGKDAAAEGGTKRAHNYYATVSACDYIEEWQQVVASCQWCPTAQARWQAVESLLPTFRCINIKLMISLASLALKGARALENM